MPVKLLMGNEALGLGAMHAGVNFVSGYPGTPSTEVLETIAKHNDGSIHVEWSTNEKAALEAAAGAAYAGARALVTMKQVGLNVASDPLMTLSYIGVEGGLVIVVADDPGPISSQTEQDTRNFAQFAKVPIFDPASPGEAYGMIQDAFELSERHHTPVIVRPTTRVSHACGTVKTRGGVADCGAEFANPTRDDDDAAWERHVPSGFVKDTQRWVVFPRTSFLNHGKVEKRAAAIADELSSGYRPNRIEISGMSREEAARAFEERGESRFALGIACGGISYHYVMEALEMCGLELPILKIGTPYPFPAKLATEFLEAVDEVICVEELDPVIERELNFLCGFEFLPSTIHGKLDGYFGYAGEQSVEAMCSRSLRTGCARGLDPVVHANVPGGQTPWHIPSANPISLRDLPCYVRVARIARASMPSNAPWANARPSSAVTSGATRSAMPHRSTWSTPACAWAVASPSRRASRRLTLARSRSVSWATRPSLPAVSRVSSMPSTTNTI